MIVHLCKIFSRNMDMVVTELAAAMPVDVMPGAEDPTNVALPQQPLHRSVSEGKDICLT